MKILVIGDTHGKLDKFRDIFPKLKNIDLIVHTGDLTGDARAIERETGIQVIGVKGNCDSGGSSEEQRIIDTEYGDILVVHGHRQNVKYRLDNLIYKALEENCRAVLFGHTHCSCIYETDGIYLVNPGSLSLPRDGSNGSYAVVRTSQDSFDASIVYYSTIMGNGKGRPKAGYIRNLLNYSDRF